MPTPDFLLFVDDSGTKEYSASATYGATGPTRYFVYGGLLIPSESAGALAMALQRIKAETFRTPQIEIKSNWLRIPHERERRYLAPYALTEDDLEIFTRRYYAIVGASSLVFIAAVIDKAHMHQRYAHPWYAPTVAYECLMQRVQRHLGNQTVAVTVDDMSGATPGRNQYKDLLRRHHDLLVTSGSRLRRGFRFPCIHGGVRFMNSRDSDLLQVADIAAYNVFRQFRDHGEDWERAGLERLPMYEHFRRVLHKFRQGDDGRIQGFGVVKFPVVQQIRWVVRRSPSEGESPG